MTLEEFMQQEGINCLTADCGQWEEGYEEFSVRPCDCCDGLAGERYPCSGYNPDTGQVQDGYMICPDCVFEAANGERP